MIKLNIIKTYFFSVDDLKRFSTNKPLLFRGVKYDYWKERIVDNFESIYIDLWDMVENGNYIPYDDQQNEMPRNQ